MKRTKLLALTLVVAIMMMGAGYAYWTQDLTIVNNISTGTLDVVFAEAALVIDEDESYMDTSTFVPTGSDSTHNLALDLVDAYPGADFTISFDLDNIGTLGAHVRGFDIVDSSPTGEGSADMVLVKSYKLGTDDTITYNYDDNEYITFKSVLESFNAEDGNDGIFVEMGEQVSLVFELEIDPRVVNDELKQDTTDAINFVINAKVHQYNDTF